MQSTRVSLRALRTPFARAAPLRNARSNPFHSRATLFYTKGDEDRTSLNPSSQENAQTGSDGGAAENKAAFDPQTTDPDSEKKQAAKDEGSEKDNPLNMSAANTEVRDWQGNGSEQSHDSANSQANRRAQQPSGGGSPNKGGSGGGGKSAGM